MSRPLLWALWALNGLYWACEVKFPIEPSIHIPWNFVPDTSSSLQSLDGILYREGKVFSGYLYHRYESGDTALVMPYLQGKQEGWSKTWYPKGRLAERRFFKQGRREGLHESWWENGKPRFAYQFAADLHHGFRKEWYESGQMALCFNYDQGKEIGPQKGWFADGAIRFNFEVRNGRVYGLTGVKNCMSVMK
jgi:antitoxin component YwqK of YwqJK toxin-antitoxin module